MRNYRKSFFLDLIKIAARRDDIEAIKGMLEFKYPGDRRNPSFAVQYYEKFVKGKNLPTPLTEDNLPQPLPETIEELLTLLQNAKKKTKKEEYEEILKSKYPDIDLTNLNEDYLSWLHQRYIENKTKSGEIVHPIEEALVTLGKFPSIQNKYKTSAEFKEKVEKAGYNEEAGYKDISSIQNLTLDQMEKIISLDISRPSIKVEGVEIKEEEFLGKFGEWNLWIPHTKETSAKIAGYDEDYNPKTDWCTGRTRGSNLFYNYIGREDIPTFLFYIIKDNPSDDEDWLSLGYISHGNILAPDFSGENGGLSVNRANKGLREEDYSRILGDSWNSIKLRIKEELEKHKVVEGGKEKYVSPARSLIEAMAKNVEEFKKELYPKSNAEKKDFIKVIMDSDPSEDVLKVCGNTLARIDPNFFLDRFSKKPWAKDYLGLAAEKLTEKDPFRILVYYSDEEFAKDYLDLAAKIAAEKDPKFFLDRFSKKPWVKPHHIELAAKILIEKDPEYFLREFSEEPWAEGYLKLAAEKMANQNPGIFLSRYSDKPWAKDYLKLAAKNLAEKDPFRILSRYSDEEFAKDYFDLAAENLAEKDPKNFLFYFSKKPWVKPHHIELAAKIFIEKDPFYFLQEFSDKPWSEGYLKLAAEKMANQDPKTFLSHFSEKLWAKDYVKLAAKILIEKDPGIFLSRFSKKLWAKDYVKLAAKILIEKDPFYFLQEFSDKPWAEDYLKLAAKILAEKEPRKLLNTFSDKPWAQPYIDLAARNLAEKDPEYFLFFSDMSWAKPDLIDSAAKIVAEKYPKYFLEEFSDMPWAKPDLIDLAANIVAEKYPEYFLEEFSDKPWAKPHHIELAKSKLKAKQASNPIQNKLLKLSNFLKSNNLKEYNYLNYYIKE